MNRKFFLLFLLFLGVFFISEYVSADSIVIKQATLPNGISLLACAENSATHKIYCFGGDNSLTDHIIEYDTINDLITTKQATLPSARWGLACAENSATHKIYCFGGYAGNSLNQIIEYTPATDQLVIKQATLSVSTRMLSCAEDSITHKIYCFGGDGPTTRSEISEYDPASDVLIVKQAQMQRSHHSCVEGRSTHKIYCFGGESEAINGNRISEYDPVLDTVQIKQSVFPTPRLGLSCAKNNDLSSTIFCFGGFRRPSTSFDQITKYDYINDQLTIQNAVLPSPREFLSCAPNSATSLIYCFGGIGSSGQIVEYHYIFTTPLINPPVFKTPPRIGSTLDIELSDVTHPNADYILAMTSGNTPGMTLLDNRNIPLNYDALLQASLFSPFSLNLFNSQSRFNNNGVGSAFWNIPNNPGLAGQDLYFGFVTIDLHNPLPQAIISISQSQKVNILPRHFTADTNTVALWNFDENTGDILTDLSGNNNNGQVHGATWTTGIDGSALRFDGDDDYVNVSNSPSLVLTNAFTIEAYVNYEGGLQDTTVDTIVGKDYQYVFGVGDNTYPGHLAFTLADQPGSLCPGPWCDGIAAVPQNSWHHVAVQYDGQTIKTIMDGQTVAEYPAQFTVGSASTALGIGARLVFALDADPVPVAFFKGKIDEVRISNVARY